MAGVTLNFIEISSSEDDRTPLKPSRVIKTEKNDEKMDDSDCIILDFDPFENINLSKKLSLDENSDDDDISIISERGLVACRDYPHSRHLCVEFPFDNTPHESYCQQCYCYVCDVPAPCKDWNGIEQEHCPAPSKDWNGIEQEHCHASEHNEKWKTLRTKRKTPAAPTVPA